MSDRINVEDLTKNVARFDMLDDDTQQRLRALKPHEREFWSVGGSVGAWVEDTLYALHGRVTYRQKPKPETVVRYCAVYASGVGGWPTESAVKFGYPSALSILRIETCTKTGKLISAKNVEVDDE